MKFEAKYTIPKQHSIILEKNRSTFNGWKRIEYLPLDFFPRFFATLFIIAQFPFLVYSFSFFLFLKCPHGGWKW